MNHRGVARGSRAAAKLVGSHARRDFLPRERLHLLEVEFRPFPVVSSCGHRRVPRSLLAGDEIKAVVAGAVRTRRGAGRQCHMAPCFAGQN
jgi:hypothetical protein